MKELELSKDLKLPVSAVTQTFAILGKRGSGKTYCAGKLCEEMLELEAQTVVLDPIGNWYGLRLGADGKRKGYSIPVFGGLHGDVPLEPTAGAMVADLVVDRGLSVVLDVSMMRKGDRKRFATDFAEQLLHRKKSKRTALHIFVEEAQVFVPQRVMADEARMLGAFEDLVKLGRNFGVGLTLISQRPQSVNKDALNQTECVVALQLNAAQERKALRDWVVEHGLEISLVDALPSLPVGTAYVWSPSWLKVFQKVRIGKKRTFDASATPEVGTSQVAPRELAPVDLEKIREAMRETIEAAAESDPRALRKRIAELEAKLLKPPEVQVQTREVPVFSREDAELLSSVRGTCDRFRDDIGTISRQLLDLQGRVDGVRTLAQQQQQQLPPRRPLAVFKTPAKKGDVVEVDFAKGEARISLPKGARDILTVLATTLRPSLTLRQVATLSNLKYTGGTFAKYVSILRTSGYIDAALNGETCITDEGRAAINWQLPQSPRSTQEVIDSWNARLPAGARAMLAEFIRRHPECISRKELAEAVNIEPSGGTFAKYVSLLKSNGLVEVYGGLLKASDTLFLEGRTG
jgi:uncharacterized protein